MKTIKDEIKVTDLSQPNSYSSSFSFLDLKFSIISLDHFTVVSLVAWHLNESEAGVDLALIENPPAFFMLMMRLSC